MHFFLFLALTLAIALALFAIQNSEKITVQFMQWNIQGPLDFILVVTFAAGMLAGLFSCIPAWWRKSKQGRAQKKRIHELERELLGISEKHASAALEEQEEQDHHL